MHPAPSLAVSPRRKRRFSPPRGFGPRLDPRVEPAGARAIQLKTSAFGGAKPSRSSPAPAIKWGGLLAALTCLSLVVPAFAQPGADGEPPARDAAGEDAASSAEPGGSPASGAEAAPSPAAGEEAAPSPMEVARAHMERGQALYNAGRYIESAEEFMRAYEAQPFAAFLYNAGVAYEKVGDPERAAGFFERYLEADPQSGSATEIQKRIERLRDLARARAEEQALASQVAAGDGQDAPPAAPLQAELAAAKARLAELQAQLESLTAETAFKSLLSVESKPEDAQITLRGEGGQVLAQGAGAEFSQTLDAGRYVVEVEHPKYKTISTPLTVAPGKVYVIIVEMSQGQFLGFLRVVSSVPGADVYVDDKAQGALGKTPFQNATPVGTHRVWVEKPGYQPITREVEVGVGDDVRLELSLERVDYGRIRVVASRPDAQVYIDGALAGGVPLEQDVSFGQHEVRVKASGMKTWKEDVTVQRGQVTPVRVKLRPKMGRAGAWVTAGAAAATLGGAIAAGLVGRDLEDELRRERDAGTLVDQDRRMTRGKILYIASDVGYGLTLGLAALATYYFLRDPLPDSEGRTLAPRDWAFSPYFSPHSAGTDVRVRF